MKALCCLVALLLLSAASDPADAGRRGPKAKVKNSAQARAVTGPVVRRSPGSIVLMDSGDRTTTQTQRVKGGCW